MDEDRPTNPAVAALIDRIHEFNLKTFCTREEEEVEEKE